MISKPSRSFILAFKRLYASSSDPYHIRQGYAIDHILADWNSIFQPDKEIKHDYSVYRKDLRLRLAPHTEPGGLTVNGLLAFRMARPALRWTIRKALTFPSSPPPLMQCDKPQQEEVRLVSFRWRIMRTGGGGEAAATSSIVSGMAHYQFDQEGLVSSIQIDRLVPPLQPNITLLEYLRRLRLGPEFAYSTKDS